MKKPTELTETRCILVFLGILLRIGLKNKIAIIELVLIIFLYYNTDMNDKIQTELDKLKEIITKTLPIDKIYLFGSYAYGNPHKDSDIDLFIILKDEVEIREIDAAIQIRLAIADYQTFSLDLIVSKKSKYLKRQNAPTLERKIAREGLLLYAA